MESKAPLAVIALTSIATGYFLNTVLTGSADAVATVVPVEKVSSMPPPAIHPAVGYRITRIKTVRVAPEPADPEPELLELDLTVNGDPTQVAPATEEDFAELAELDFVAMLREEGADVEEGFDQPSPGTLSRMTWKAGESLYGSSIPTPVLVAQGVSSGPTLCLTAAVHGDELNGIETVRRVMYSLNPEKLSGRVIGVPIVNLQGFERHSRYLPDRRDLNRFFPGNPRGSSASRIAFSFFEQVVRHCDALVDLHTGSFHRTNLPQLRANLQDESVIELSQNFGGLVILHSMGGPGTLRAAAVAAGVPAVTLEAGEPLRVDDRAVDHTVKALFTLMDNMSLFKRRSLWGNPEPTFYSSLWVRADKGGMLLGEVKLGKRVKAGEALGTVTDPITNVRQEITAPRAGRVIGMALNQFVMPGYAAFHLGVEAPSIDELPDASGDPEIDHSVALLDGMIDERDDSDE